MVLFPGMGCGFGHQKRIAKWQQRRPQISWIDAGFVPQRVSIADGIATEYQAGFGQPHLTDLTNHGHLGDIDMSPWEQPAGLVG